MNGGTVKYGDLNGAKIERWNGEIWGLERCEAEIRVRRNIPGKLDPPPVQERPQFVLLQAPCTVRTVER